MLELFKAKNINNFSPKLLNELSMKDIFKGNYPNQNSFMLTNQCSLGQTTGISGISNQILPSVYDFNTMPKMGLQQMRPNPLYQGMMQQVPPSTPLMNVNLDSSLTLSQDTQKRQDLKGSSSGHRLFNTTGGNITSTLTHTPGEITSEVLSKKRKRFIKNNKLVFVQPGSAAARKLEMEVSDKVDDIGKLDNNEELFEGNLECNSMEEQLSKSKKPRGSRYRGVSRNGNQWQVLIMVNKKKRYVGSYSNEEEAARAYDKVALQNHGSKAKTNFDYVEEEVQKILSDPPLLKINA